MKRRKARITIKHRCFHAAHYDLRSKKFLTAVAAVLLIKLLFKVLWGNGLCERIFGCKVNSGKVFMFRVIVIAKVIFFIKLGQSSEF